MVNKNKFYVTTPIYYPNSKPHVGTLYSTLIADVAARFAKLMGKEVFFLTGTDEHGQKLQEKAAEMQMDPKTFIDGMIPAFTQMWKKYEIEYSKFIRTTDDYHEQAVARWIEKLQEQGDIYKSEYTGLYCVPCETFVNVQVDSPKDEKGNYVCPTCKRGLREVAEESYFFRLSAYEERLLAFYENNPDFIVPKERLAEVISFVKSGLKDLSISRKTVSWGIPFPGDPSHTVYVWGDALNNYITGVGYGQDTDQAQREFAQWWPADVQVMAKDIVRFHAVYWPAFLIAAGLPLPKQLLVHGYILMGDSKMSKSLGNAVNPDDLAQWYGVEPIRYYLMRQMPITQDGHFDLKDLENRINADLANSLGNLLNRMQALALNNGLTTVTAPEAWEAKSCHLREMCEETYRFYWDEMNKYYFHVALSEVWKFIALVNAYFHEMQPWILAKQNKEMFAEVIAATCNSLYSIALMLMPIMPKKMETLLFALGQKYDDTVNYDDVLRKNDWNRVFTFVKLDEPLFVRPESRLVQEPVADAQAIEQAEQAAIAPISIDDFAKCHLVVGTVLSCEEVKGSDKLYKLQVDLGSYGKRQIFSGVRMHFAQEELLGKQAVFVANLPPRKMMGQESQGMMLVAKQADDKCRLVTVDKAVENGSRLT